MLSPRPGLRAKGSFSWWMPFTAAYSALARLIRPRDETGSFSSKTADEWRAWMSPAIHAQESLASAWLKAADIVG
jgi:hypothetical protein